MRATWGRGGGQPPLVGATACRGARAPVNGASLRRRFVRRHLPQLRGPLPQALLRLPQLRLQLAHVGVSLQARGACRGVCLARPLGVRVDELLALPLGGAGGGGGRGYSGSEVKGKTPLNPYIYWLSG